MVCSGSRPMKAVNAQSRAGFGDLQAPITRMKIVMSATIDADATGRRRPIQGREFADEATLLFLTSGASAKLREALANCGLVDLSYSDSRRQDYVSVSGIAQVVEGRARMHEVWSARDPIRFPQGPDDPDATLVRVVITKAEYRVSPNSAVRRRRNWTRP